jgi:hypothetical protein
VLLDLDGPQLGRLAVRREGKKQGGH